MKLKRSLSKKLRIKGKRGSRRFSGKIFKSLKKLLSRKKKDTGFDIYNPRHMIRDDRKRLRDLDRFDNFMVN